MNYLRKKLQGLRMCADFKGYLREVTGAPPLTLTDCMGLDLVSLSVTGKAVQDGTPSPDTPIAVQGVGERTGNLFSLDGRTELHSTSASPPTTPKEFNNNTIVGLARNGYWDSSRIVSYSFDGDNFTLQSSAGYGLGFDFDVSEGETYTIKFDSSAAPGSGISFYDANGIFKSWSSAPNNSAVVTIPSGAVKLVVSFASNTPVTISNLQVVKGSYTASNIPAYALCKYKVPIALSGGDSTQTINIYTDKPLYAVGGAGDIITVDFDAKTATRTDKTAEIKAYNNEPISGEYISSTGSLTEGAQVIYALSEPVTADISDLQNWDEVPSLWRGTATVSAETAVQPSSVTVKYYATKKED